MRQVRRKAGKATQRLGLRYFLDNWRVEKNVYANGFFTVKGEALRGRWRNCRQVGLFGSRRWRDTGAQCKIRVLESLTVVLLVRTGSSRRTECVLRYSRSVRLASTYMAANRSLGGRTQSSPKDQARRLKPGTAPVTDYLLGGSCRRR